MAGVQSEHMFDKESLVGVRERAAVLALLARRPLPWNRLAGAIEEEGSALRFLQQIEADCGERLFPLAGRRVSLDQLEELVQTWAGEGIALHTVLDPTYPVNLRTVHDRPPALFVRGALEARDERSVAVVGTRSASQPALDSARRLARELVAAGHVIVSGLAAGIDTAAHSATIAAGGRTVAVIGTGLHHAYPSQNAELQRRLARESAVVSQFWPGQGPRRWTFPRRNAVMSGLARATVVVEASHTSGARMQARLGLEHGRPVFLMEPLLEHAWAREFAERPGAYVVGGGDEVIGGLERLYSGDLSLHG